MLEGLRALYGEGNVRDRMAEDAPVPLSQARGDGRDGDPIATGGMGIRCRWIRGDASVMAGDSIRGDLIRGDAIDEDW